MLKSATILCLLLWNLHEYIPAVPNADPVLGVLVGMFCGVLVVGYMVVKASQMQPARQPIRRPRQTRRQQHARLPMLAGQMALQGGVA